MKVGPFKSVTYAAATTSPGPKLIVLGAVHGNETCGTRAIERLIGELDAGDLVLAKGSLTLVPVTNPLAYANGRRVGDRNLNRKLTPGLPPREFEDRIADWLCPLLAAHDLLLDLHSFQSPGLPFALFGPRDNDGPLEPFAQAKVEEGWVRRLGVRRAVDGWLSTYAKGVERRQALATAHPESAVDADPRYGVGTTEFMRSRGGAALTLECGRHDDPEAPAVGHAAILATLAHFGLVDAPQPPPVPDLEQLTLVDVVDRLHPDDRFAREWRSFDAVRDGETIGTRADGSDVVAPFAGRIVFPNPLAAPGHEWFYLARAGDRIG